MVMRDLMMREPWESVLMCSTLAAPPRVSTGAASSGQYWSAFRLVPSCNLVIITSTDTWPQAVNTS